MGNFLQQVFALLTSDAGSLTYHLVLAFSIVGSLQSAFSLWRKPYLTQGRRLILGLSLLLLLQLVLFVIVGLSAQGLIQDNAVLPPFDRAVSLLSLILIIWLWAFPDSSRFADLASIMVGLLVLTISALGIVWWSGQAAGAVYNNSFPDTMSTLFALLLIIGGAFLLLFQRPPGWSYGLSMFVLFFIGGLLHLLFPLHSGDYPGVIRLTQMAAFPLLFFLPQRFADSESEMLALPEPKARALEMIGSHPVRHRQAPDPKLIQAMLTLATETLPEEIYQSIAITLAKALQAEICVLTTPPNEKGVLSIQLAFDVGHEVELSIPSEQDLRTQDLPVFTAALRSGRPALMQFNPNSGELLALAKTLSLVRTGPVMAAPIATQDGQILMVVFLLCPTTDPDWKPEDKDHLAGLTQPLAHFLQLNHKLVAVQDNLTQATQMMSMAQNNEAQMQNERQSLMDQVAQLRKNAESDRAQIESLALMVAAKEENQDTLAWLQSENERLQHTGLTNAGESALGRTLSAVDQDNPGQYNGELRMALEEIAQLRSTLAQNEREIQKMHASAGGALNPQQGQAIEQVARELRQSMASIVDYTDLLLGDSVGELGTLQKKFLERVRASSNRIGELIDDLGRVSSGENPPPASPPQDQGSGFDEEG